MYGFDYVRAADAASARKGLRRRRQSTCRGQSPVQALKLRLARVTTSSTLAARRTCAASRSTRTPSRWAR